MSGSSLRRAAWAQPSCAGDLPAGYLASASMRRAESRTDSDLTDEAAWAARSELAAASDLRRKVEESERSRENNESRLRLAKVASQTDVDISDEAAGMMRSVLAAESAIKRESDEHALSRRAHEERERLKHVAAKTDDDLMDEAAGMARLELAAESKARFAREASTLRKENAAVRARRRAAGEHAKTDHDAYDDVMSDGRTAGQVRAALAAASTNAKSRARRELQATNAALRERLGAVHEKHSEDAISLRWGRLSRGRFGSPAVQEAVYGTLAKEEAKRVARERREAKERNLEEERVAEEARLSAEYVREEKERVARIAEAEAIRIDEKLNKEASLAALFEGNPGLRRRAPTPRGASPRGQEKGQEKPTARAAAGVPVKWSTLRPSSPCFTGVPATAEHARARSIEAARSRVQSRTARGQAEPPYVARTGMPGF